MPTHVTIRTRSLVSFLMGTLRVRYWIYRSRIPGIETDVARDETATHFLQRKAIQDAIRSTVFPMQAGQLHQITVIACDEFGTRSRPSTPLQPIVTSAYFHLYQVIDTQCCM